MRQFGIIHTRFWEWAKDKNLSPGATLLGAYLLSCSHSNPLGVYRITLGYIDDDLNLSDTLSDTLLDKVWIPLQELSDAKFLRYCEPSKHVFLLKYLKWNKLQNRNHAVSVLRFAVDLPRSFPTSLKC